MWTNLLRQINLLHRLEATDAEWSARLAPRCIASFPEYFPQAEGEAEWVPCRSKPPCGCPHEIRNLSGGRLIAACSDPDAECPDFSVHQSELAIYRFDLHRLAADIAEALTIEPTVETVRKRPCLVRLGTAPHAAWPVFIGLHERRADHLRLIETAAIEPGHAARILLLSNTDGLDPETRRQAHALGVKIGFLDHLLDYDEHAGWMARSELEDIFPDGKKRAAQIKPLRLPKNAGWGDIVVTLTKNGRISIAHKSGNPHGLYRPEELGFFKLNGETAKSWDYFKICVGTGCIPAKAHDAKAIEFARNRARDVSKCLGVATRIKEFGFKNSDGPVNGTITHHSANGFWPLFKIRADEDRYQHPSGNYQTSNRPIRDED